MIRVVNWWKWRVFCGGVRVGKMVNPGGGCGGGSWVRVFGSFIKFGIKRLMKA